MDFSYLDKGLSLKRPWKAITVLGTYDTHRKKERKLSWRRSVVCRRPATCTHRDVPRPDPEKFDLGSLNEYNKIILIVIIVSSIRDCPFCS